MTLVPVDRPVPGTEGYEPAFGDAMGPPAPPPPSPAFHETFGAAWRQDNIIGSTLSAVIPPDPLRKDGSDTMANIRGTKYERHSDRFLNIFNVDAENAMKAQLDMEERDRETLDRSGFLGDILSMGASIADPTILLPGGAILRGAKGGYSALRTAGSVGVAAAAQATAQEAILQATQQTRPIAQSAFAIGGSAILGAALGGTIAKFLGRAEFNRLSAQVARDLADHGVLPIDANDAAVRSVLGEGGSVGAAAVPRDTIDDLSVAGKAAGALQKATAWMRLNPFVRSKDSPSVVLQSIMENMMESSVYLKKNMEGRASAHAVETLMKEAYGQVALSIDATKAAHIALRKEGVKISYGEFKELVGKAMRRGDLEAVNPQAVLAGTGGSPAEVAAAKLAKTWRERVFDPLKERAIKAGLLPEDVKVSTADSYFTRVYNRNKIDSRPEEWRNIVRPWVQGQVDKAVTTHTGARDAKVARIQQTVADLKLEGPARLTKLAELEKQVADLRAANTAHTTREQDISRLRRQLAKAKEAGDETKAAQHEAAIKTLRDAGGDEFVKYQSGLKALRSRINRIRDNIVGKGEAVEKAKLKQTDIEAQNVERLYRLKAGVDKLESEIDRLDPELHGEKIADLREQLADVLERSAKAEERIAKLQEAEAPKEAPPRIIPNKSYDDALAEARDAVTAEHPKYRGGRELGKSMEGEAHSRVYEKEARADVEALSKQYDLPEIDHIALAQLYRRADGESTREAADRAVTAYMEREERRAMRDYSVSEDVLTSNDELTAIELAAIPPERRLYTDPEFNPEYANALARKRDNLDDAFGERDVAGTGRAPGETGDASGRTGETAAGQPGSEAGRGPDAGRGQMGGGASPAERAKQRQQRLAEREAAVLKRIDELEEIDPAAAIQELRKLIDERITKSSRLVERGGEQIAELSRRIKAGPDDIEALKGRVKELEARAAKAEEDWHQRTQVEMGEGYVDDIVESITNQVTGRATDSVPYNIVATKRGPLKERTFNIPDELIEPFLESDIEMVGRRYARVMAADTELAAKFGSPDLKDQVKAVHEDYRKLAQKIEAEKKDKAGKDIPQAKTEKRLRDLAAREKADIRDLEAVRDILRGQYKTQENASGFGRIAHGVNQFNYMRALGGVVASSLTDVARPMMVHGLMPYLKDGIGPLLRNLKAVKMSVAEARLANVATERANLSRISEMADLTDPYSRGHPVERWLDAATHMFSRLNGLALWTDWMKQIAGTMTQNRIVRGVGQDWAKLPQSERAYLSFLGIDRDMAERIGKQFSAHGEDMDGVKVANTEQWDDIGARRAYRAAMVKDVDSIIVTPGVGDKPLLAHQPIGKALLQFKSYMLASHQKVLMRGLQEKPAAFINGIVSSAVLGMFITYLKAAEANRLDKLTDNPGFWIAEGLDRSSIMALMFEASNTVEKWGGPGLKTGAQALFPGASQKGPASRYASRSDVATLLGPTADLGDTLIRLIRGLGDGDATEGDVNSVRRLLPFSTLPGVRSVLEYGVMPPIREAVQ